MVAPERHFLATRMRTRRSARSGGRRDTELSWPTTSAPAAVRGRDGSLPRAAASTSQHDVQPRPGPLRRSTGRSPARGRRCGRREPQRGMGRDLLLIGRGAASPAGDQVQRRLPTLQRCAFATPTTELRHAGNFHGQGRRPGRRLKGADEGPPLGCPHPQARGTKATPSRSAGTSGYSRPRCADTGEEEGVQRGASRCARCDEVRSCTSSCRCHRRHTTPSDHLNWVNPPGFVTFAHRTRGHRITVAPADATRQIRHLRASRGRSFRVPWECVTASVGERTQGPQSPSRRRGVGRSACAAGRPLKMEPDAEDMQLGKRQHRFTQRRVVVDRGNVGGEILLPLSSKNGGQRRVARVNDGQSIMRRHFENLQVDRQNAWVPPGARTLNQWIGKVRTL